MWWHHEVWTSQRTSSTFVPYRLPLIDGSSLPKKRTPHPGSAASGAGFFCPPQRVFVKASHSQSSFLPPQPLLCCSTRLDQGQAGLIPRRIRSSSGVVQQRRLTRLYKTIFAQGRRGSVARPDDATAQQRQADSEAHKMRRCMGAKHISLQTELHVKS